MKQAEASHLVLNRLPAFPGTSPSSTSASLLALRLPFLTFLLGSLFSSSSPWPLSSSHVTSLGEAPTFKASGIIPGRMSTLALQPRPQLAVRSSSLPSVCSGDLPATSKLTCSVPHTCTRQPRSTANRPLGGAEDSGPPLRPPPVSILCTLFPSLEKWLLLSTPAATPSIPPKL